MNRPVDDYGVPIFKAGELESSAEKILGAFDSQFLRNPGVTDIERLIGHFVEIGGLAPPRD